MRVKPSGKPFWPIKPGRHGVLKYQLFGVWAKLFMGLFFLNLRQVPERIVGVARFLRKTSREVEPKFLEMGQTLETLYGSVNGLTKYVNDVTLKLSGTEEGNLLDRADGLAEEAGGILERYQKQAATSLTPVKILLFDQPRQLKTRPT